MYEFYSKEKLNEMYPILETSAEMIINFVSCDGSNYKLSLVLGDLYPSVKAKFQRACFEKKVEIGNLLINKKITPAIIHLPVRLSFKENETLDFVRAGFEKLSYAVTSGKINIKSVAIQKGIIDDTILFEAMKDLELPEVIFYEHVDYYKKIEDEAIKERKAEQEKIELKKKEELELESE